MGALSRMKDWILRWFTTGGNISSYQQFAIEFADEIYNVVPGITFGQTYEPDPINYPGIFMPLNGTLGEHDGEIYLSNDLLPAQTWIWQNGTWNGMSAAAGVGTAQFVFRGKFDEDVDDPGKYREVTGGVFPTAITWWENAAKLVKVKEVIITRNVNQLPTTVVWNFYVGGLLQKTYTDVITYSGVTETNRTRSIT